MQVTPELSATASMVPSGRVAVDAAILHLLEPGGRDLKLSVAELSLSTNPEGAVREFLEMHIGNSLTATRLKAARFRDLDGLGTSHDCRRLLADRDQLVDASQSLAKRLYRAMQRTAGVSPGVVAVCNCRLETGVAGIAILKLDPASAFRAEVLQTPEGAVVRLEAEDGILPSQRERLQKFAFIHSLDSGASFHMRVLDLQQHVPGIQDRNAVARFFLQEFLEAEPAFDAATLTKDLYRGILIAQNRLRAAGLLSSALEADVEEARQAVLHAQIVDVPTWIEALPIDEACRNVFREELAQFPAPMFSPDPSTASDLTRRTRFVGDNNLRLQIDPEYYKRMIEVRQPDPKAGRHEFEVVIRTQEWREVTG